MLPINSAFLPVPQELRAVPDFALLHIHHAASIPSSTVKPTTTSFPGSYSPMRRKATACSCGVKELQLAILEVVPSALIIIGPRLSNFTGAPPSSTVWQSLGAGSAGIDASLNCYAARDQRRDHYSGTAQPNMVASHLIMVDTHESSPAIGRIESHLWCSSCLILCVVRHL